MRYFLNLLLFLFPLTLFAQADLGGHWEGHIQTPQMNLGVELDLEKQGKKKYTGTMDVPVQKLKALPLTEVEWDAKERKLKFKVPDVPGNSTFRGKLSADGDSLIGSWTQNMYTMPMLMGRPTVEEAAEMAADQVAKLDQLRSFVDSVRESFHVPGIAVAIVKDGEVILSEGFGFRDRESETPVDAETRFAIGSCSKAFTAFGLGVLADEGKLDWETPIRDYLPAFSMQDDFATQEMNTIDLLTHRSGLPRHDFAWYGSTASREELFARLPHMETSASFRFRWQYQNFMYMTAGILAGKLDASSWEQVTQSRILDPLGMDQTTLGLDGLTESENASLGYAYNPKKGDWQLLPYRNINAIGPAGSINSNARDMAKWLQVLLEGGKFDGKTVLSSSSYGRLFTPYLPIGNPGMPGVISPVSYGLGWMCYHYRGHQSYEHGGNIDGFSASVMLMPDDNFGAVILTNLNGTNATSAIGYKAADLLLDLESSDWIKMMAGRAENIEAEVKPIEDTPIPDTQPGHVLSDYVGEFTNPGYGNLEILLRDDTLRGKFNGFEYLLSHWHFDVFKGKASELEFLFNFRTSNQGFVTSVEIPFEPSVAPISFELLPPSYLSEMAFKERLTGTYDLKVIEATIELVGEKLIVKVRGQSDQELEPLRQNAYAIKELKGFWVEFEIDPEGKKPATAITVHQPNVILKGERSK